jgi:hypothetical protein
MPKEKLTKPHTRERQDAITWAKSAGRIFKRATGPTLNGDDLLIGMECVDVVESVKQMENSRKKETRGRGM